MIDDLITRGVTEPYRMFTSRAEYRLRLRADNADQRMTPAGERIGVVGTARSAAFAAKQRALEACRAALDRLSITPDAAAGHGLSLNRDGRRRTAFELLGLSTVTWDQLSAIWPELRGIAASVAAQTAVDARYAPYLDRQDEDVRIFQREEAVAIPPDLNLAELPGLSAEVRQKLQRFRPASIGQASRIDGMTPAALMILLAHVKKSQSPRSRANL
jgi:tRNA uridine 5-carboxymethylaminomethyl modification enzyme